MPSAVSRVVASLLAASVLLAVAGCGGGDDDAADTVDTASYASSVCTAITQWQERLAQGSAVLLGKIETEPSLKKVQTQFVVFFGDALAETDEMLGEVEAVGVPDLAAGEEVSASVLQSLRRFRPILITAQKNARALPVGNEAVFTTKAQILGVEYRAEALELPELFGIVAKRAKAPELTAAVNAEPACSELRLAP